MKPRALLITGVVGATMVFGAGLASAAGVVETLKNDSRFTIFAKALEQAGYAETLAEDGPYTIFAPTDEAFDRLPRTTVDELLNESYAQDLEALIGYHVVNETLRIEPLIGRSVEVETSIGDSERLTLEGTYDEQVYVVPVTLKLVERDGALLAESTRSDQPAFTVRANTDADPEDAMSAEQKDRLFIFPARIVERQIEADEAVIHAIDAVLIPKEARYQIKWERKENQLGDQSGG